MDLTRVQTKEKEALKIKTNDKYHDRNVLTLLAATENSKKTIKFNKSAFDFMGVDEVSNNLVLFEKYNVANDDENPDYKPVLGVVSEKAIKLDKKYKSYEIALNTRNVKSKEIYDDISKIKNTIQQRIGTRIYHRIEKENENSKTISIFLSDYTYQKQLQYLKINKFRK